MNREVKRILYCCPQTAGDVFISTGVIDSLKKKFPGANIYFATEPQYFDILKDNPNIFKVIEYHDSMLNYRNYEAFAMFPGLFDIVYCPFIITQRIPHWIHGGHGEWLGRCYADMCNIEYGNQFIAIDDSLKIEGKYITVQSQTRQDPKDYDFIEDVIKKIKNFTIVQIGGPRDKKLDVPGIIDLRGQTTPQQLTGVLKNAIMHLGHDSFPMHIAGHVGTPSVILFGGTYAKQGIAPHYLPHIRAIETDDRGPCVTSCHLSECQAKSHGHDKCINHIPVDAILEKISEIIGQENIEPPEPIVISSYMIIKDGIKYGFPFEESIKAAAIVSDEVIIVDGGSTDDTYQRLMEISMCHASPKIKVLQHPWDMDNPTLFGDEKTWARQQCTGNWLIQLDADEIIQEPKPGAIRNLIKKYKNNEVLDLPVINMYGNDDTTRIEEHCWKWRISKNNPNIIHGVHAEARQFDADSMRIVMDKKISDGCEYIYADTLQIVPHKAVFSIEFAKLHYKIRSTKDHADSSIVEYNKQLDELIKNHSVVFHYSWHNLERKKKNGEFWDNTWHGKKDATHNTSKDIGLRIDENSKGTGETIVHTPIIHPLRKT